jgi:hypothetical protein
VTNPGNTFYPRISMETALVVRTPFSESLE